MSTAEILSMISLISYVVAGVCAVLAVLFWFFFGIPSVVGDLSGRTARKSIEKRRKANARSGQKSYRPSAENAARGKLTETMPQPPKAKSEKTPQQVAGNKSDRPETEVLSENRADAYEGQQTELLDGGEATTLLVNEDATAPLNAVPAPARRPGGKKLTMINEVMVIHTDEVISW